MKKQYKAVLFDLLTALLDSWTVWNNVAGTAAKGAAWRKAYLNKTYACGAYRPYTTLVEEAAIESGLPTTSAHELTLHWQHLQPWNDVEKVLSSLPAHIKTSVVTNCSEKLGYMAAQNTGVPFNVIVTAERAGFYKPHKKPYQLALQELGTSADNTLFVAGSPYDLFGTAPLHIDTYWHNRINMQAPPGMPAPIAHEKTLLPLLHFF
jgi:2-haloacid dehalogenase